MNSTGTRKPPKAFAKLAPGWSLTKLSEKTGFSVPALSRIFTGERGGRLTTIKEIAKALGKTDGEVFSVLAKIKRNGKG